MFIEFMKEYIDRKTTLFLKTAILGVGYQNGSSFPLKAAKANFCSFLETWRMGELRPAESYLLMEEIPHNHRLDV